MKRNVFLIGMMGSGKSTVGQRLAELLDMTFVDIDDLVEAMAQKSISQIFEKHGEKRFREMEGSHFREKAGQNSQVFSTGGGIVLDVANRKLLKNDGFTVLLRAKPGSLAERIRTTASRPLLRAADDLEEKLAAIWNKRRQYYESSAHLIIDTDNLSPGDVVKMIMHHLRKIDEDN